MARNSALRVEGDFPNGPAGAAPPDSSYIDHIKIVPLDKTDSRRGRQYIEVMEAQAAALGGKIVDPAYLWKRAGVDFTATVAIGNSIDRTTGQVIAYDVILGVANTKVIQHPMGPAILLEDLCTKKEDRLRGVARELFRDMLVKGYEAGRSPTGALVQGATWAVLAERAEDPTRQNPAHIFYQGIDAGFSKNLAQLPIVWTIPKHHLEHMGQMITASGPVTTSISRTSIAPVHSSAFVVKGMQAGVTGVLQQEISTLSCDERTTLRVFFQNALPKRLKLEYPIPFEQDAELKRRVKADIIAIVHAAAKECTNMPSGPGDMHIEFCNNVISVSQKKSADIAQKIGWAESALRDHVVMGASMGEPFVLAGSHLKAYSLFGRGWISCVIEAVGAMRSRANQNGQSTAILSPQTEQRLKKDARRFGLNHAAAFG